MPRFICAQGNKTNSRATNLNLREIALSQRFVQTTVGGNMHKHKLKQ